MKLNPSKQTLVLGACVLFAITASLRADDGQSSDSSKNNDTQKQASQSSDNGDGKSSSGTEQSSQSSDNGDGNGSSGKVSPVQSSADPYGLKKAGLVMEGGSTAASASFDKTVLPSALQFCATALPDGHNNLNSPAFSQNIDPNKLVLATKQNVTATFISESAGFQNSLGFVSVAPGGSDPQNSWQEVTAPTAQLIFPNVSSSEDFKPAGNYSTTRTASQPLQPGDFVNMGTYSAGTKLDFFLIANGANQAWAPVFSSTESINNDGFTHHVGAFTAQVFGNKQLNSPYVFLTFKDYWGGGDKDMNDVVVALNVGAATVKALLATPEPSMWLTFGSFLMLAVWAKRRMDKPTAMVKA